MFSLIKNFLREKEYDADTISLSDLHVGCIVGFGFMPQTALSGHRMPVTELNSYLFDNDHFISYRLENGDTDVSLIVAGDGVGPGSYLALSQRINEHRQEHYFAAHLPEQWFELAQGDSISLSAHALSLPQGWFAPRYTLAMKAKGRVLEGDYRLRKPAGRLSLSEPFDYVLLVDEANTHALEAERYESGELKVYCTIYRPATDIGEITRPLRVIPLTLPELPEESEDDFPARETKTHALHTVQREFSPEQKSEPQLPARQEITKPHQFVVEAQTAITPVHGKFGRIQPAATPLPGMPENVLICDTRLAGKIISEAQRNQMPLSELIRKVIDLPASIHEQVLIPFSLSNAEIAELARRYALPATDYEAVKERILEELGNFVGQN